MASIWRDKEYQFQADDGTPLNAGTVQFYTTGTSTPKDTYSNEGLSVANTNPVVLDADGRSANNIWISGRYRVVVATSGGTTIADIDPVEDSVPSSDFQDGSQIWGGTAGGTATAITFSLTPAPTAYTDGMEVGWRWNADTTGATTINVNGLGAKSLVKRDGTAIASGDGQQNDVAVAKYNSTQDRFELVTPEGMLYRDGNNAPARADVASAATLNLDTAGTKYVNITGTTGPITAITLTNGRVRRCRCDSTPSITTGASLIINGIASGTTITFAAGDTFEVWGEPSSVVRIVSITRVGGGADGLLSTTTASAAASVDMALPAGFTFYKVLFAATVGTDGDELYLRIGTGSPPTYQSGAANYEYERNEVTGGANAPTQSAGDTQIIISNNVGSAAAEGSDGWVEIFNPASATRNKLIQFFTSNYDNAATSVLRSMRGTGSYNAATTAITGLQILASSGTISGTFKLYGYA